MYEICTIVLKHILYQSFNLLPLSRSKVSTSQHALVQLVNQRLIAKIRREAIRREAIRREAIRREAMHSKELLFKSLRASIALILRTPYLCNIF